MNRPQLFDVNPRHWLVAAFSGLLLTLCFPRYGHPLVAWIALLPLLYLATVSRPSSALALGWVAGVAHGLSLLYWISYVVNHYGNLSLPVSLGVCFLLVAYLAVFPGLFCAGLSWLGQRDLPWLVFAPFLWVACELGKSTLLTGFPWENLGYSQYRWLPFIQVADLTGVYGISFLLVLVNSVLFYLLFVRNSGTRSFKGPVLLILTIAFVLTVYGYGRWRLDSVDGRSGPSFNLALVQGNIDQDVKWNPAFQKTTIERYARLTREVVGQQTHLVVWPETAAPFYFLADSKNSRVLIKEVQRLRKPLLFGSPAYRRDGERLSFFNRAYLVDGQGRVKGRYDKIHLVPFGEYVPYQRLLFFVNRLVQAAGDFAAGDRSVVMDVPPARVGVLICYEAIFPQLSRKLTLAGANLLINITNDAWFGRSSAPYQHLSMAVLRAVENRVPLARSANTGISAFIDAGGRILQTSNLFEEATMKNTLRLGQGTTIYCRYGDWFAWSCLFISLAAFVYSMVWRGKQLLMRA
ncbi:MAG: apolipoprotein N-acyltransferase [Deltaproteobacteria bacterium]|nr:MAG: apolipoprotein N-acyltransferase [Deltaproteobacteria bacterium]